MSVSNRLDWVTPCTYRWLCFFGYAVATFLFTTLALHGHPLSGVVAGGIVAGAVEATPRLTDNRLTDERERHLAATASHYTTIIVGWGGLLAMAAVVVLYSLGYVSITPRLQGAGLMLVAILLVNFLTDVAVRHRTGGVGS